MIKLTSEFRWKDVSILLMNTVLTVFLIRRNGDPCTKSPRRRFYRGIDTKNLCEKSRIDRYLLKSKRAIKKPATTAGYFFLFSPAEDVLIADGYFFFKSARPPRAVPINGRTTNRSSNPATGRVVAPRILVWTHREA